MARLSEKENFMRVINGETPEWVPRYTMGPDPYAKKPPPSTGVMSSVIPRVPTEGRGFIDIFGVEFVATKETGWMSLPKPGKFVMDDISKWRDIVKLPDLTGIDWDAVCKKDVGNMPADPNDAAVMYSGVGGMGGGGFFMPLMNMMGFTNGLMTIFEEPELVHEMFDYMADWYCYGIENTIDRLPVDVFMVSDDTATATNPFISPEMYREMIKPYVARTAKYAVDRGIPVMMHNCGRCEDSIDDWRDFGVTSWNPAQIVNDLDGIKKKYGNSLVLIGCWDSTGPVGWPHATEDFVRQTVRDTIDRYAAGGGFMFWGSVYGPEGDEETENKRRWITEEYEAYRETPYK